MSLSPAARLPRAITGALTLALAAVLSMAGNAAHAQAEPIQSQVTSLRSKADRMISYRSQQHMWQTADGATHAVINRGPRTDRKSLALFSTHDGGATWSLSAVTLPGSNGSSTSDGYLVGNRLHLTWDIGASAIRYAEAVYDPAARRWTLEPEMMVVNNSAAAALVPAMAADARGRQWLAYTQKDKASGNYAIKMMRRDAPGAAWVDTGFTFGPVDNVSNERSGRPLPTSRGIGMVYTVKTETFWAERANHWALEQPWARAMIYTKQSPGNDPYGTHFSITADEAFNLHMVSTDGGRVIYSRYLTADRIWQTRVLTEPIKASYVQATMAGSNVVLVSNAYTNLSVFQSSDGGTTFFRTHALVHPAPVAGESYDRPRVETPAVVNAGPMPVLQQFVKDGWQRALFFAVPIVADPAGRGTPPR